MKKKHIAELLQRRLKPLLELRGFEEPITVEPAPLTSLNGSAETTAEGERVIVMHANVLSIHDRLGQALSLLTEGKIPAKRLIPMMQELRECVRSPESLGVVPDSRSTDGAFAFTYSRLFTMWLLAHEFGHIELGHTENCAEPSKVRWDFEFAADEFALRLVPETKDARRIEGMYETALGFWLGFLRYCEYDNQGSFTHPPMRQRIDYIRTHLRTQQRKKLDLGLSLTQAACFESPSLVSRIRKRLKRNRGCN